MSDAGASADTALRSAPQAAPAAGGMRRIPFPLESYQHPSAPLSDKWLLNLYAEQAPADARSPTALISSPGLVWTGVTLGGGPVVVMNSDISGVIYAVSGTHFYRVTAPTGTFVAEDLGEVGLPEGGDEFGYGFNVMTTIAAGAMGAVVCVPPRAYTCSHTGALNEITGDFPGARSVAYLDGYFVFTANEIGSKFFICKLLDPESFDALDFAYADGLANIIRRVVVIRGELWFLGDNGIEIWYDSGNADFPFRRQSGGVIPFGVGTLLSAAISVNSMFWVTYGGTVMHSVGYRADRVSTHAIEAIIRVEGTQRILRSLSYVQDGHTFYALTIGSRTLVYDLLTGLWHDRSSSFDGSLPWAPTAVWEHSEGVIFGTATDGRIFWSDPRIGTEDGDPVIRQMIMPPLWAGTARAFCSRLEIEMEVGGYPSPPGYVTLDWSDDGGRSWTGGPRTMFAGLASNFRGRVFTTRLGSFRQRIFRVTAVQHVTYYAVDAAIQAGNS
jgi:hypothetical protein